MGGEGGGCTRVVVRVVTARTRGDWNIFRHGMAARIALKSSRVLLTVDLLNYRYLTVFKTFLHVGR